MWKDRSREEKSPLERGKICLTFYKDNNEGKVRQEEIENLKTENKRVIR